ncbi:MAG: hypothetical protein KAT15_00330 [Bacteroidales bacterium]|nr:hypothetical protein [Bacteroidales bacterium]
MNFDVLKTAAGVSLFFVFSILTGQGTFPDLVDHAFGLDQDLVNGVQYYNRYLRSQGHPYFLEDRFENGSVTVDGKLYQDVKLKYDLFSQRVELEYKTFSGGDNRLITVAEHMDAFRLGLYKFSRLELDGTTARFYQVIASDHFTCLVHWQKKLIPINSSTVYIEQFTKPSRTYWLELDGRTEPISNRKTFAKLFPLDKQQEIRRLIRQKHFSFRNATPDEIIRLIHEVSDLVKTGVRP